VSLAFPTEEFVRRVRQAELVLDQNGLDALIAYSVGNQAGPTAYFAGYEPRFGRRDVAYFIIVPGPNPHYIMLANAYWDNVQEATWTNEVFVTPDPMTKLPEFLPSHIKRLGVAGLKFLPWLAYRAIQSALPAVQVEDATQLMMNIAKVKSSLEVEVMRKCTSITDAGGQAFLSGVREGAIEHAIKADMERAMLLAGADGVAFPTLLFSGDQVTRGIGFSSNRALQNGEQVNSVWGALYKGYKNDLGRVTTAGFRSREARNCMETAAEMWEAMFETVHAGAPIADLSRAALDVVRRRGMESYLQVLPNNAKGYGGHGIGCWLDEFPEIHAGQEDPLETNMVLVLEARLGKPGAAGATITEPIVVGPKQAERLSSLSIRSWSR